MSRNYEIEDIDEMRRQAGIDDVELRADVRALVVGDRVKVTLVSAARPGVAVTVVLRITSVRADDFRGVLERRPAGASFTGLRAGSSIVFAAAHVHSITDKGPRKIHRRNAEMRR